MSHAAWAPFAIHCSILAWSSARLSDGERTSTMKSGRIGENLSVGIAFDTQKIVRRAEAHQFLIAHRRLGPEAKWERHLCKGEVHTRSVLKPHLTKLFPGPQIRQARRTISA